MAQKMEIIARQTSQKKIIYDYLMSVKIHPTAEAVYENVKKKLPQISQATVYRVLNNLKIKQKAITIMSAGVAHFDADMSPHTHFICEKCNDVFDVPDECSNCGILKNIKTKVGKINNYKIYFYGKCNKCEK
jgi:Fur family peroxide stress response transcriptional regulator